MTKVFNLVSDEEYDRLSKKYNILAEDDLYVKKIPEIDKIREYYKKIIDIKDVDSDCKKINEVIKIGLETKNNIDYMKNIVVENGYRLVIIDKGTEFYKALTGFYDKLPNMRRTWCANLKDVMFYLKYYYVASIAYKCTKKIKLFIVDTANLTKLMTDNCPPDIVALIKDGYYLHTTLEEVLKKYHHINPLRKTWIYKKQECDKNSEQNLYDIYLPSKHYEQQNTLYDYIESRFKCDGTIFGPAVSPFKGCMAVEYAIHPEVLEIDKKNKYTWMNWDLQNVKEIGHFNIDVYNSRYTNANNKIYHWLKTYNNLDYSYSDILSINVHELVPIPKKTKDETFAELVKYVNIIKPKILALQEMPKSYITRLRTACNFFQSYYIDNGGYNDEMEIAVFVRKYSPAIAVKNIYDAKRGAIILLVNNKRLMFVHGPIGKPYFHKSKIIYTDKFYDAHNYNKVLRDNFLNDIVKHKPDFIIGDFNIIPVETQTLKILQKAGYKTDVSKEAGKPTSIHGVKVDWAWYKPDLNGKFHIYNWHLSDHRPVGFTFDKWDGLSKWNTDIQHTNNIDWNGNKYMIYGNIDNIGPNSNKWNWGNKKAMFDNVKGGDEYRSENLFSSILIILIIFLLLYLFDVICYHIILLYEHLLY